MDVWYVATLHSSSGLELGVQPLSLSKLFSLTDMSSIITLFNIGLGLIIHIDAVDNDNTNVFWYCL